MSETERSGVRKPYISDDIAERLVKFGALRPLYKNNPNGTRTWIIEDEAGRSALYVQQLKDGLR